MLLILSKGSLLLIQLSQFFAPGSFSHRVTRSHRFGYARNRTYSTAIVVQLTLTQSINVRLCELRSQQGYEKDEKKRRGKEKILKTQFN